MRTRNDLETCGCRLWPRSRNREQGNVRIILLALLCVAMGFGGGIFFHNRVSNTRVIEHHVTTETPLTDGTRAILQGLDAPVEIRYYWSFTSDEEAQAMNAFASRVTALLAAYEAEGRAKVVVARHEAQTASTRAAAAADGLRPLPRSKGDPVYLGLVVAQDDQREVLAQLSPEWEPALESDLSRAIARVSAARRRAAQAANSDAANQAATEAMKRSLPNYEAVSAETGAQMLREAGLKEFKAAAEAMEVEIKKAEAALTLARSNGSAAEQETARADLLKLHTQQAAKLKEIAIRYQTQVVALERMKGVAKPGPTSTQP